MDLAVTKYLYVALVATLALCATAWALDDPNPPSIMSDQGAWPISRQWNVPETHHFATWINQIYKMKSEGSPAQRRAKLEGILTDPETNLLLDPGFAGDQSNPQLPLDVIRRAHSVIDCAKLTVVLSSYYAYRRGLPWMITYVHSEDGDLRTATHNIPSATLSNFDEDVTLEEFFSRAVTGFCTGNFRVNPFGERAELSDTVPVAIDHKYLIPGCLNYLDGHVLIVAEIDHNGEPRFLDATTAASRDIYSFNGLNAVMGIPAKNSSRTDNPYAGCFQGLRVYRFPVAVVDADGEVTGVRRRTDEEMKEFGYSTEEYDRVEEITKTQHILEKGIALDSFHEFIQMRMRPADAKLQPAVYMNEFADELIRLLDAREEAVQSAWQDVNANGPITYPEDKRSENIFTAGGRWGEFSSASNDVDLRSRYYYLADWMDDVVRWYERQPDLVDLAGLEPYYIGERNALAQALIWEKNRVFSQKQFHYRNSDGQEVSLSLLDIEKRIYDLSFDPNHPPELRWGAPQDSKEFSTAKEVPTLVARGKSVPMLEAYRLESYYRTVAQRETTESYLRSMFTSGYPVRERFDLQLAKWMPDPVRIPPLMPSRRSAHLAGAAPKAVEQKVVRANEPNRGQRPIRSASN